MKDTDLVIVGAGIAGLSLAYFLRHSNLRIKIIEQQPTLGGMINTVKQDGFQMEVGPNTLLFKPVLRDLILELGIEESLLFPNNSNFRYILKKFQDAFELVAVPSSLKGLIKTDLMSLKTKLRLLGDIFTKKNSLYLTQTLKTKTPQNQNTATSKTPQDISIAEFFQNKFGDELVEMLLAPAINGVWAGDVSKISLRSSMPTIWKAIQTSPSIFRGLIRNMLKKKKIKTEESDPNFLKRQQDLKKFRNKTFSFIEGNHFLIKKLAENLGSNTEILYGHQISSLNLLNSSGTNNFEVKYQTTGTNPQSQDTQILTAKNIVLTCGSKTTSSLLQTLAKDPSSTTSKGDTTQSELPSLSTQYLLKSITERIDDIPLSSLGMLHIAIDKKDFEKLGKTGFGFLIPPKYRFNLLGVIFTSELFPHTSPADKTLLTCFAGGINNPEYANVEDPSIQKTIVAELAGFLKVTDKFTVIHAQNYLKAIPNYPLHHYELQESLKELQDKVPGIYFLANWLSGISVPSRVEEAKDLAKRLLKTSA